LQWAHHKLIKINVLSKTGGKTTLIYGDVAINIDLEKGKSIEMFW
jgi:alpha-L-fucosidase 2